MLNILHTIPTINDLAMGPSYSVVKLCEHLNENCNTSLLALCEDKKYKSQNFTKLFKYGWGPKKLGRSPEMFKYINFVCKNSKIDIIHNHSLWMMPNIYPSICSKKYNKPLIISPRGTLSEVAFKSGTKLKKPFWELFQKKALQIASCFHATAYSEYLDIRRLGFKQPVAIIPNGIDLPSLNFERPLQSKMKKELLYLGRVHPIKGLDILLDAWREIESEFPNWILKIIGPDYCGYKKTLQSFINNNELKRVQILPPVFNNEKHIAFLNADLFVLPSYSENFGVSVAEALSYGIPSIVSKSAPWEGLKTNNAGFHVEPNYESFAKAIKKAINLSKSDYENMSKNGRNWMETNFSWYEVTNKMLMTYEWMVGKNNKPDCVITD